MRRVLDFVRSQMALMPVSNAAYSEGYLQALTDVADWIEEQYWEAGEDVSE